MAIQSLVRLAFPLAIATATLVAGIDLALETPRLSALLFVAPLVAAAGASAKRTAIVAVYAVALAVLCGAADGVLDSAQQWLRIAATLIGGALAVLVASLRASREVDSARLEIQYSVARTLYEARSLEEAAPRLLETIGRPTGWEVGGLWLVTQQRVLRCVESWYAPGIDPEGFDKLSRQFVLRPGFGLPGRVWETGEPSWIYDVLEDHNFPRAELASKAGLRGAVGFPIRTQDEVLGVIEFFTREFREPGEAALAMMAALGSQVGEFIERRRASDAVRASEARKGAMLESALDGVITIDHEGRVVEFNRSAERAFGYRFEDVVGLELAELIIPPGLRDRHRLGLRRQVETGEGSLLGERVEMTGMRLGGEEFPVELAVSRIGGHDPPMFTAYVRDITERKQAETERERLLELERIAGVDATQARDQLAAILSGVADGVIAHSPDGGLIFANQSAARMTDFDLPEDLIEASGEELLRRIDVLDLLGRPLGAEALQANGSVRLRKRATGEELWVVVKATPIKDDEDAVAMTIVVLEDVTDQTRRERVQHLLAETGRVLSSSMEADEMLDQVAGLLVPELADWCVIYLTPGGGIPVEPAAMAFGDAANEEIVRRELDSYPPDAQVRAGIAEVVNSDRGTLWAPVTEADLRDVAQDEAHLELMRAERMRSRVMVPISIHDHVFGAMSLATAGSGRVFDDEDLRLAGEIARRTGSALENARLYAERSHIAATLQSSLLPPELPDIPGLAAAARFRPTGDGNEVGGDFYDLFPAGEERWAIAVGDVCGKGPDAAAVTALARYTLRAAAMDGGPPSHGLEVLNEALLRQRGDLRFCTVTYAHVEQHNGGARVTLTCGGHPLPLVLRAEGSVEWLGAHGTLLGVVPDPDLVDTEAELRPGDVLVFYTDGVSEARGEHGALDEAALAELVRSCAGLDPEAIAERIESAAVEVQGGPTRDDIAVLVLQERST